jgi:hypothetical protein
VKSETLSQKHKKRAGRVAKVVECLTSKHEALIPNPKTVKQRKKKKRKCLNIGHFFFFFLETGTQYMPMLASNSKSSSLSLLSARIVGACNHNQLRALVQQYSKLTYWSLPI